MDKMLKEQRLHNFLDIYQKAQIFLEQNQWPVLEW